MCCVWLEVFDEEYLEFLRGVEDFYLVVKFFVIFKFEFRDVVECKEDDGVK